MRRLFTIISIAVLAVMTSSCYDDSKIFGELSNLGDQILSMNDRLTKVENELAVLQGDVNALAELSQALKSGIYIKSITALADGSGYTITFSDDRNIVVKNAEFDTEPAFAVGVMTIDGKLVWAVNGEPLKNGDKYVEVHAATPIFQVNQKTRKLEVSYDNGNTWVVIGDVNITVEGGDNAVIASCIFSDVKVDENAGTVTFTLAEDGSKIVVPLAGAFELVIESEKIVRLNETSAAIPYMVKGADEDTQVRVFTAGRCAAEVRKDTIFVSNITGDREILVYADNCKGKTSIRQVKFTRERFNIYGGNNYLPYEGGQITINGISNIDFEVRISEKADWITQVETKAEEFYLTFDIAQNETAIFREGVIDFVRKGTDEVLMSWVIYQDANPNAANTISTAEEFIAFLKLIQTADYNLNDYILTADIDLSNVEYDWSTHIVSTNNMSSYCEISGAAFKGTFDGCGHKITGFNPNVELPELTTFGLFPSLCYGTIKNLDLTGEMTVSANNLSGGSSQADAGMLVGTVLTSTIQNVTINGKIISRGTLTEKGRLAIGSVCGYAFANIGESTLIENAVVNVEADIISELNTLTGTTGVMYGGVVGFSTNSRTIDSGAIIIKDCVNNGNMNVNVGRCAGIIATANYGTNVENCVNNGNLVSLNSKAGLIGGVVCYMAYGNITDCVNNGNLDATASGYTGRIGGIICNLSGEGVIKGGGNYGTINTLSSAGNNGQYRGLLWAYFSSNKIFAYDIDAGGKLVIDGFEQDINIGNYMDYIGNIRYPENVFGITWQGNPGASNKGIDSSEAFVQFLNAVRNGEDLTSWMNENGEVVLTADIDLSGVYYDWMSNVTSVTNSNYSCMIEVPAFSGVFDGQNHKITGFNPYVQLTGNTTFGLFPVVSHGTIKNLELSGRMDISATGQADAGMLVGTAYNSTIQNVTVNGKIVSTGSTETKRYALGGAVGFAFAQDGVNTVIENVVVNVEADAVGGNNAANGATAAMYGGIVGFSTAINAADQAIVIIKDCVNNGDMNVTLGCCSGIVSTANTRTTIQGCTNNGDQVNKIAKGRLGNIVCNMSHYCNVIDCVNNGDMDVTVEGYNGTVGGLIALAASANGCTISGGGNYGTIRTVGTAGTGLKYVGLLWANHNNRIPTSGVVAGGKIIVDGIQREINESNYMEHIGYIKYPEFVTDITWGGSDNPSESDMPTIREFAQEYVKLIDVWQANVGTVNTTSGIGAVGDANDVENAHFIPDDTKLKVGEVEYNLADALELASRSYLLLRGYDGNDTKTYGRNLPIAKLDAAYTVDNTLPETHAYTWGKYPYAERTNGGAFKMVTSEGEFERCKVDLLDDFSHRHTNYPLGTGGAISNFCGYTGGYLAGYDGCCCAKRITLAYAYFFKYMLDNNLQDATTISADQVFEAPLFGEPAPAEPEVPAFEPGAYWIMGTKDNVTKVMSPLAAGKNYGYAPSEEAVEGKSYAKNVFTFAAVEGGFTIADASGRYYYQEKGTTYKTFNAGTDGTLAGCVWTVTKNADDTYAIVNKESGKTIRYAEGTYTSFGVYTDAEANGSVLVNLVKADNPLEEKPTEPEQPEQPQEPVVLAEWLFTMDNLNTYADSFGGTSGVKDNTAGDGGKRIAANVSGTGYISYVQIDKTALDPDNKVQRKVGSTGHPHVTGGWVGDYWLFTFGDKGIAKSSKVSIKYITRTSATGMKYWRLEYLDGTEWKPAMATTKLTVTDGSEIAYNIAMNADGTTNVEVDVVVEYANDTAEPCFRMLCLANEQANGKGPLEAINSGTVRIAGAVGTSPIIKLVSAPSR